MSLGSSLWVSVSLRPRVLVDFIDVTLADDDTNSILEMKPIGQFGHDGRHF